MRRFPERDARIYEQRRAGRTLADIGREFGISKERVRQISFYVNRQGRPLPADFKALGVRAQNCVRNQIDGFSWARSLRKHTDEEMDFSRLYNLTLSDFLRWPNCGKNTAAEILAWVEKRKARDSLALFG